MRVTMALSQRMSVWDIGPWIDRNVAIWEDITDTYVVGANV